MSETSRRELLRDIALSVMTAPLTAEAAQHVHQTAAAEKKASGAYHPKCFQPHEYAALQKLCELICPRALEGGALEFIDLLASQNPELATIYTGGLGWLDHAMETHHQSTFLAAKPEQQTALLDRIAYRRNESAELGPGILFFDWARRMTIDAYYTSKAGIDELGYKGNQAVSKFEVPAEAIEYAVKRSPFGQ